MIRHSSLSTFILAAGTIVLTGGCAHEPKPAVASPSAAASPSTATATSTAPPRAPSPVTTISPRLAVSSDVLTACKIEFNNVARAPKFDFDTSGLEPQDRAVLDQVATCMTTGPLKNASIALVGRAGPRGEAEYNMALGEHRANTVRGYLLGQGVAPARMEETSRGKLDASGKDEAGWARDRRVDVILK